MRSLLVGFLSVLMVFNAIAANSWIAIDVGHSIATGGSKSAMGVPEFQYNQRLAHEIVKDLTSAKVAVKLVNGDGRVNGLIERTTMAAGASLFVSIHHDSVQAQFLPVTDPRFAGYSIWVSRKNGNIQASLNCARLISDQLLQQGFRPSNYHAEPIQGENRPVMDGQRGIFANDDLIVLKTAQSAAILIEAGVIVNPEEEAKLRTPAYTSQFASSVVSGINACIGNR